MVVHRDFLSSQIHFLIFNLDAHIFHCKIVHQTPEISVHKGPNHDLISKALCKRIVKFDLKFLLLNRTIL